MDEINKYTINKLREEEKSNILNQMAHQTGQSHHELIAKQNADRRYERFTPTQVHDPLYETKKDASTQAEIKAAVISEGMQTVKKQMFFQQFANHSKPSEALPEHMVNAILETAPVDDHALIKEQVHKSELEIKRLVDENRKMSEDLKTKASHIAAIEAEKQVRELDLVKDVKMGNVHRQKRLLRKEKKID
jgi:hypothetical protein